MAGTSEEVSYVQTLGLNKHRTFVYATGGIGTARHPGRSDHVRIASYMFIDEYQRTNGRKAPGVIYNKCMTLLYRELKSQGTDIRLPHCWYRWGDIVVKHSVPYVGWVQGPDRTTTVEWADRVPEYSGSETVSLMRKYIVGFVDNHSGREGHEIAKDEVYEGAPFRFQNEYRMLRETLDSICRNYMAENSMDMVRELFDSAMGTFPDNDFRAIRKEKEGFEAVFRMALDNGAGCRRLYDFAELFWFFFCYHLRIHRKCHENVTNETLDIWKAKIPWETLRFGHILQNHAEEFYAGEETDRLVASLLSERARRMEEVDGLISKLSCGHSGSGS